MEEVREALQAIEKAMYNKEMEGKKDSLEYWELAEIEAKLEQYIRKYGKDE